MTDPTTPLAAAREALASMVTVAAFLQSCVLSGEHLSDEDRIRVAREFDAARALLRAQPARSAGEGVRCHEFLPTSFCEHTDPALAAPPELMHPERPASVPRDTGARGEGL